MNRHVLFPSTTFDQPLTLVSEHTQLVAGTLKTSLTALIDGRLTDVHIECTDDTPIKISALATLVNCTIDCNDLLIEGAFSGEIKARGHVELGDSAQFQGNVTVGGQLLVSHLADAVDMRILRASAKASAAPESPNVGAGKFESKPDGYAARTASAAKAESL